MTLTGSVRRFALSGLVSLLLPAAALAQAADSTAYPLAEIVVSATDPVSEATATVRVVTASEIKALGARTLDEALTMVPGLYVRTGADGVPRVDVRGFRTRQVTLLLNGIPLNSTDDGQFDPSLLPVEEIAEIKMTSGTGSVLYGQGGLGAIINIITRSGHGGRHLLSSARRARRRTGWAGRSLRGRRARSTCSCPAASMERRTIPRG